MSVINNNIMSPKITSVEADMIMSKSHDDAYM